MSLTANIIGATGLVGTHLVRGLLSDDRFSKVKTFTRRSINITDPKLEEHIIDFNDFDSWKDLMSGDVLFSALGTTLQKAGSKSAQYKVDYHYQYNAAYAAITNNVPICVLVSAPGAKPDSPIFYNRMKGQLDRDIKKLGFKHLHIIKPGLLSGRKHESRPAERIGAILLGFLAWIPGLSILRPIGGDKVAKAMINAAFLKDSFTEHSLKGVFKLAKPE